MGISRWGTLESETGACLSGERGACLCYVLCTQEAQNKCLLMSQRWHPALRNTKLSFTFSSHLSNAHKERLGRRGGHGCICFIVQCVHLGHLMPTLRYHICLIKCEPTLSPLLGPSGRWPWETGTCSESPVNLACKGRQRLLGPLKWRQTHC